MTEEEIYNLVIDVADQKGSTNQQMLKHLKQKLEKQSAGDLFNGLYRVFLSREGDYFNRQQLAGKMLYKIRPRLHVDLVSIIKGCLDTYNLSIEELPFYLKELCNIDRLKAAMAEIETMPLNNNEQTSLNTFKFWLGLRDNS